MTKPKTFEDYLPEKYTDRGLSDIRAVKIFNSVGDMLNDLSAENQQLKERIEALESKINK